jgi:Putative Zn-dependent protease, contains TPR repeats
MTTARMEALQKLLATNPNHPMAHYGLANEYWKLGDYQAVVKHMTAYLETSDDQGAGYRLLGQAYHYLGDIAAARAAWEQGQRAAERHGHPSLAAEIGELLAGLEA